MNKKELMSIHVSKCIKKNFKSIFKKEGIDTDIKRIIDPKYLKLSCPKYDGVVFKANKKMRTEYNQSGSNIKEKIYELLKQLYHLYYEDEIDDDILSLLFDISISNMGEKNFMIIVSLY